MATLYRILQDIPSIDLGRFGKIDAVWMFALLMALVLHVAIIFGITFAPPKPSNAVTQEVTVAIQLTHDKNEHADFLAQANQQGGGEATQVRKITNSDVSQYHSNLLDHVNPNETLHQKLRDQLESNDQQVLYTTMNWVKEKKNDKKSKSKKANAFKDQQNSTAAMIATLEAEFAKQKESLAKENRIETVNSVSTRSEKIAPYVDYFKKTVERVGNRYYPDEAKIRRLGGDVRLLVILKPDGSVKAIQLLKTSGSRVLDEAAKQSVRYGAPYKKFPIAMSQLSELRIIRTWRFSPGSAMPVVTAN